MTDGVEVGLTISFEFLSDINIKYFMISMFRTSRLRDILGFFPVNGMYFEASFGLCDPLPEKNLVIGQTQLVSRFFRLPLKFLLHLYFLFCEHLNF